jgi:glycosyltransferase involved in cell wall biosynthesis
MSKPRVLMVISLFTPYWGGSENQALLLSEHLIQSGIDVSVLTRQVNGLPEHEHVNKVPVSRSIRTFDRGKLFGVTYFVSCLKHMVLLRNRYDIIHCHIIGLHCAAAVVVKIIFGKKVILKVASTDTNSDLLRLVKMRYGSLVIKLLQRADVIVALCRKSAQEALKYGFLEKCIRRIPNGVDTLRFRPATEYQGLRDRIVFVGRLAQGKGVDILLEAFSLLRREGFNMRLDIYGAGPELNELRRMADGLGLRAAVLFHGQIGTVEDIFDNSCVFVQPSLVEGMSNVILEAMAAGLPVVATRTGAAEDMIRDGVDGLLVDTGSARQIHDAVVRLLSDEALAERIGRQARALIESRYSIEQVALMYHELYRELLGPTRAASTSRS